MYHTRDAIRRQLELEDEQRSLGAHRYRKGNMPWKPEAGAADEEANLPPGKQLLKLAIEPTEALLREFIARTNAGAAGKRHSAADPLLLSEPLEVAYPYRAGRLVLRAAALLCHAARPHRWLCCEPDPVRQAAGHLWPGGEARPGGG